VDSALSVETEGMSAMTALPDELKLLAAEYALGTLEGADRERAEALEASADDFRTEVGRWRGHLLALDDTAFPQQPGPELWQRIHAGLGVQSAPVKTVSNAGASLSRAALLSSLAFWRGLSLAGVAASILLGAFLWTGAGRDAALPSHVAVLVTPDGRAAAIINAFADGTAELVPLEQISAPQGRTIEVWTQQAGMSGPVSIGRLDTARRMRFDLKSLGRPGLRDFFALTFEQSGGSPTGAPTGAILMKGVAAAPM
jgi:anti-sigma-K factor RskA